MMEAMRESGRGRTRNRPAARLWAAGAALAAVLAVGGCGLFTPAEPEPPGGGGGGIRLPNLTEPDSALYSLETGIEKQSPDLYRHAIAETTVVTDADFHAVFDPQDTLDYQISTGTRPPEDWTSRDEMSFFPYFASLQPVNYDAYFTEDPARPDQRGPNTTILYRRYRIWAGGQPLAVGLADMTFRRVGVNLEWKLVYWVDRRDTSATVIRSYGRRRLDSL
jgi:hypothetical protein